MKAFYAWLALGLVSACSSSNPTDDGGSNDASNDLNVTKDTGSDVVQSNDATADAPIDAPVDAPKDAPVQDAKADTGTDASDAGTLFTLTINDYVNWCGVSVNNGQPSTADPQTFQFPPDASVSLHGDTANSLSFYWGYWQSANLADGGKDTNMDVTIKMNGNVNVLACCPINNTALSCP